MAVDPFIFYRYFLGWVVTIYATIVTLQWAWGWLKWLSGEEKYVSLLRRYLLVHGLRLRFTTFWGDLVVCVLLTVAFLMLWELQILVEYKGV